MKYLFSALLCFTFIGSKATNWQSIPKNSVNIGNTTTPFLKEYGVYSTNIEVLKATLLSAPKENSGRTLTISLPEYGAMPTSFEIQAIDIMESELAAKYSTIKTYAGRAVKGLGYIRMEITYLGVSAMVVSGENVYYIEPYNLGLLPNSFLVFNKNDSRANHDFVCNTENRIINNDNKRKSASISSGAELRTYKLVVAATGEYTATKGGSLEAGLSGIIKSINRVDGIYETELAIRLVLQNNTDKLIYINGSTDPYTNNDGATMLGENQANIDKIIGSANYNMGHVFSTGGGGIAQAGICQTGVKARGVTGLNNPTGDNFDVDFVAHEMGHQFGANHTFNSQMGSCGGGNRNTSTAYEPGSAITILGYAGICGSDDVLPHSIPYFHTASFDEIMDFTTNDVAASCPTKTATGNTAPVVDAGNSYTIPANTPFMLTGSATDAENDKLTYSWEEFDLGPAGTVNGATGNAPILRNYAPEATPTRYFPRLSALAAGTTTYGEKLPSTQRTMNFRLVARDNKPLAGGVDYAGTFVNVTTEATNFNVTSQNTATSWNDSTTQTITWAVANTNASPVNCSLVKLLLSVDGGLSFPILLAQNEPNDGSANIIVPAYQTTKARIMVLAQDNIFFDINNANIEIVAPTYTIAISPASAMICGIDSQEYTLTVTKVNGFNDTVTLSNVLPSGLNGYFTANNIVPPATLKFVVKNLILTNKYSQSPIIISNSQYTLAQTIKTNILFSKAIPIAVALYKPDNAATNKPDATLFVWKNLGEDMNYSIEIATDINFVNIFVNLEITDTFYVSNGLSEETEYFWRVKATNICGTGVYSEIRSFTTAPALPSQPSMLKANGIGPRKIELTWRDNSNNELGFILSRSFSATNGFNTIDTLAANAEYHVDSINLLPNRKYFYKILAYNIGGNSNTSNTANDTTLINGLENEIFNNNIEIYPNPTANKWTVSIANNTDNLSFTITDNLGRALYFGNNNGSVLTINASEFANGFYFLNITNTKSKAHTTKKLIKG